MVGDLQEFLRFCGKWQGGALPGGEGIKKIFAIFAFQMKRGVVQNPPTDVGMELSDPPKLFLSKLQPFYPPPKICCAKSLCKASLVFLFSRIFAKYILVSCLFKLLQNPNRLFLGFTCFLPFRPCFPMFSWKIFANNSIPTKLLTAFATVPSRHAFARAAPFSVACGTVLCSNG